ncbi:MAG: zinc-dependent metalloprotease [Oligoflexia bacterium]|nr:zinc-dependent metalloprotease [Oligoflexia bacterium]MBF0366070.1 zinc-dependent metalloprotease [Oligoflexia bacterium]
MSTTPFVFLCLLLCSFIALMVTTACGPFNPPINPKEAVHSLPPLSPSEGLKENPLSPTITTPPLPALNKSKEWVITLQKSGLKSPLLMQSALMAGVPLPLGEALASKVVYFEQREHKLYLFQHTSGQLQTPSLPIITLIAEFPIIEESPLEIVFDFKSGIGSLIDDKNAPINVISKYINTINVSDNAVITIDLFYLVEQKNTRKNIEVIYSFSPYKPKNSFTRKKIQVQEQAQAPSPFFLGEKIFDEKAPWPSQHILKLDLPIKFTLSMNTPKIFHEAVRDGINYWNQIFQKEILTLEIATRPLKAFSLSAHQIQWIDTNAMDYAYTDVQSDPLTGEILSSQIYIPSSFLNLTASQQKSVHPLGIHPEEFVPAHRCIYPIKFSHASVEDSNKHQQNYFRTLIAHEIGHALGLAHNFAGSLEEYPSSTVMDYLRLQESSLVGELIKQGNIGADHFTYDRKAIAWGYQSNDTNFDLSTTLFCSDNNASSMTDLLDFENFFKRPSFYDCFQFDSLANPLLGAIRDQESALVMLTKRVLGQVAYLKQSAAIDRSLAILATKLFPINDAKKIFNYHSRLFHFFSSMAKSIKSEASAYDLLSSALPEDESLGILLFPPIGNTLAKKIYHEIDLLIPSLSKKEESALRQLFAQYIKLFDQEILQQKLLLLQLFELHSTYPPHPLQYQASIAYIDSLKAFLYDLIFPKNLTPYSIRKQAVSLVVESPSMQYLPYEQQEFIERLLKEHQSDLAIREAEIAKLLGLGEAGRERAREQQNALSQEKALFSLLHRNRIL